MPSFPCLSAKRSGFVTSNPASIPSATSLEHTLTIPGAKVGDFPLVIAPSLEANLTLGAAYVSAVNTVKIRICNPTVAAIDPASQAFYYMIF